jgi:hypothetical protein
MTPLRWDDVMGLAASRDYKADDLIDEPLR